MIDAAGPWTATTVYDVAQNGGDSRTLFALYVGDWDPSGLYMSERDLPDAIAKYGLDPAKPNPATV